MKLLKRIRRRRPREPSRKNPTKNEACSDFEVDAWQLSEFVVAKLVPVVGIQPFPLNELLLLSAAVCRFRPSHIFDWGTHVGKSARSFYEVTRHYGIPSEIHSVDLPDDVEHVEHPARHRGRMVRGLDRVHLHQGDGVEIALALWREAGKPEPVLFFIDGDHAEASVARELAAITASIERPVVLLHDTFYQSPESGYNVGPHRAIDTMLAEAPKRFRRLDSGVGLPGMTLLYPAG